MNIVDYGKDLFHRLNVGALSIDAFKLELQGKDIPHNEWGVLQCFCENDERPYRVIEELSIRQMADAFTKEPHEFGRKAGMVMLCQEIRRALEIERHWPPAAMIDGVYVKLALDQFRASYGEQWSEFLKWIDDTERRLPFFKPQLDRVRAYADLYPTAG